MKTIVVAVAALAALTGCATQRPNYYAPAQSQDPYQWRTVAVLPDGAPVRSGTWIEELPAQQPARTVYSGQQAYTTTYVAPPVYYAPAPVYYTPPSYYYPPVALGLNFSFGRWYGRGGRGYYRHR